MNHAGWCTTDMAPCAATVPSVCPIENSGLTHHLVSPSSSRFLRLDFNSPTFDSHFPLLSGLYSSWNHPPGRFRAHPTRHSLVTSALALVPLHHLQSGLAANTSSLSVRTNCGRPYRFTACTNSCINVHEDLSDSRCSRNRLDSHDSESPAPAAAVPADSSSPIDHTPTRHCSAWGAK